MGISPAALAALCDNVRLVVGDIRENSVSALLLDERTHRHADNQVLGVFAATASALAVFAFFGYIFALIAKVREG